MGNKILSTLGVAPLNPVGLIEKQGEKEAILSKLHHDPIQGGHTGITKTLAKVKRHYFWNGMNRNITEYIQRNAKKLK